MAFTTTQALDSVLLRGMNFRTPANAAISSQYTLYANGNGLTYWSNSLNPSNLSTFSTSISKGIQDAIEEVSSYVIGLNTSISSLQSSIEFQSTQISIIQIGNLSTASSLMATDAGLSTATSKVASDLNTLAINTVAGINNSYAQSVIYTDNAILNYSNTSTFYGEISTVQFTLDESSSTLSTTIGVQDTILFDSLTANYTYTIDYGLTSTIAYVNSVKANNADLLTFSTVITEQLLSTSEGIYNTISSFQAQPLQSTVVGVQKEVTALETWSTNASTITHMWISSFVSTSQNIQDKYIYGSISTLSSAVEYYAISTANMIYQFGEFSSITRTMLNSNASTNEKLAIDISTLQHEFSVITTSSILAGIYDTFMDLEYYTSTLIGSTIGTFSTFESHLYASTTAQNESTSYAFFTAYTSSMYISTLSTIIPVTTATMSSMISTLYSTSYTFLISSLNSTVLATEDSFLSTTSSYTTAILYSSGVLLTSSILGYISSPGAALLSTYSTLNYAQLSTFTSQGNTLISSYSTALYSSQSSFNILYISTTNLYNSMSTQLTSFTISSGALLLSSYSLFSSQQSTQTSQFNSTIMIYPINLTNTINSTNAGIYTQTSVQAGAALTSIVDSTNNVYNDYVLSLQSQLSVIGVSTLYTFQDIALTGSNFTGIMDLATYRNFNISVYGIQDGLSNYRIGYTLGGLDGLKFCRGVITINISTSGSAYTNNNGQLRFDAYRWGIPTTVWGNVYPYISNAEYTIQYEYTIFDKTLYTNLLNVYPKIDARNATISSIVQNVTKNGTLSSDSFWRGTPVQVNWTNYSFFPYLQIGAPPFNPEVGINIIVNNSIVAEYGPFLMYNSTAVINAPYLINQAGASILTTARVFVLGRADVFTDATFNTILPKFTSILMNSNATGYLAGTELVAVTDTSAYPLYNIKPNINMTLPNITISSYNNNSPQYTVDNLTNGILNRVGRVGSLPSTLTYNATAAIQGSFYEASVSNPNFYVRLSNYFEDVSTVINYNSQFTFTFSNAALSSYTFTPSLISSVGGVPIGLYRLLNSNVSKTSNTFTSGTANMSYTYTPVKYISSCTSYAESTFVGPINATTNDPKITMTWTLSETGDNFNKIIFYNLLNDPLFHVQAISTTNLQLVASFGDGGNTYASTFITNGTEAAQVFRI
jgi:hypothetical protein